MSYDGQAGLYKKNCSNNQSFDILRQAQYRLLNFAEHIRATQDEKNMAVIMKNIVETNGQ